MSPTLEHRRRIGSPRLIVVPGLFLLLMAALPWIVGWLVRERRSAAPGEFLREAGVSAIILMLGCWILTLIRREQLYTLRHLDELEQLTLTDPLTGLGNRRALQ